MTATVHTLPVPAVILGIDQGSKSGFSIWVSGELVHFNSATHCNHRRDAVSRACVLEQETNTPLIVCFEDHSDVPLGKSRSTRQVLGMGAAKGRWLEQLDEEAHPRSRIVEVKASQWRQEVLGIPRRSNLKTAALKDCAIAYCQRFTVAPLDHDSAEAVCIGFWATRAPVVRKMVPLTWRRRSANHG